MFKTLKEAFKTKDVRNKLLLTILLLVIYRVGCYIPIPGISVNVFSTGASDSSFLTVLSSISGGALSNGSLLALGVSPYISASIIVQLLGFIIPAMQRLGEQGDVGRQKLNLITRIVALVMCLAQAIAIVISFNAGEALYTSVFKDAPAWISSMIVVLVLTAGGMFTVWLGERITDLGIGNGLSLILFVGILSSAGQSILTMIQSSIENPTYLWNLLIYIVAVVVVFGCIVFIDLSERKIPVQYANQLKGRRMYGGQSSHIPLKINANGVMPLIFAYALVAFPQMIISMVNSGGAVDQWYAKWLGTGTPIYYVLTSILILLFSYFWTKLTFQPDDIAKRIQQNAGFIPGIRPGKPTAEYLNRVSNRITLFGAIFLALVAFIPSLVFSLISGANGILVNAFSATGLLIVVSVALEFDKQLESQLLMRNYKGFLK